MTNKPPQAPAISFRVEFAPAADLAARMDPDAAEGVKTTVEQFPGEENAGHRGALWVVVLGHFSRQFREAVAEAIHGGTAEVPDSDELADFLRAVPSRRETAPDGTTVLFLPSDLTHPRDSGEMDDFLDLCDEFDGFIPYFDAAARLYGAISLDLLYEFLYVDYDVDIPDFPDWIYPRLERMSGIALCRGGVVFHRAFEELLPLLKDGAAPGVAEPSPDLPEAARALAAHHEFPHFPVFINDELPDFLRWADPEWFGNGPDSAQFDMRVRNSLCSPDSGEREIVQSKELLFDLAQFKALDIPVGGLLKNAVPPELVFQFESLMESIADWARLWTLGGNTREGFEEAMENVAAELAAETAARHRQKGRKKGKRKRRR